MIIVSSASIVPSANEAAPLLFYSSGDKRGKKQHVDWTKRKDRWLKTAAANGGDQKKSGPQSADMDPMTILWLHNCPKSKIDHVSYKLKWNHLIVYFDVPSYRDLVSAGDFRHRKGGAVFPP